MHAFAWNSASVISPRDREALDQAARRTFAGAFVTALDIEMQARRLTVSLYGALQGGAHDTSVATLTFFGASALALDNGGGSFPQSVAVASLALTYDDEQDAGRAELRGSAGWALTWAFEGLGYAEYAATLASYADDFDS